MVKLRKKAWGSALTLMGATTLVAINNMEGRAVPVEPGSLVMQQLNEYYAQSIQQAPLPLQDPEAFTLLPPLWRMGAFNHRWHPLERGQPFYIDGSLNIIQMLEPSRQYTGVIGDIHTEYAAGEHFRVTAVRGQAAEDHPGVYELIVKVVPAGTEDILLAGEQAGRDALQMLERIVRSRPERVHEIITGVYPPPQTEEDMPMAIELSMGSPFGEIAAALPREDLPRPFLIIQPGSMTWDRLTSDEISIHFLVRPPNNSAESLQVQVSAAHNFAVAYSLAGHRTYPFYRLIENQSYVPSVYPYFRGFMESLVASAGNVLLTANSELEADTFLENVISYMDSHYSRSMMGSSREVVEVLRPVLISGVRETGPRREGESQEDWLQRFSGNVLEAYKFASPNVTPAHLGNIFKGVLTQPYYPLHPFGYTAGGAILTGGEPDVSGVQGIFQNTR